MKQWDPLGVWEEGLTKSVWVFPFLSGFWFLFPYFSLSRENVTFKLFWMGEAFAGRPWGMTDQHLQHYFSYCS